MKATWIPVGLASILALAGCKEDPLPVPKFENGQMVRMVAFQTEGMVIGIWCRRALALCTYDVRFSALQMRTDVSLLGSDGPITLAPVARVLGIREYELEAVSGGQGR